MTMYSAAVLLNGSSRFQPYSDGDKLAFDARCLLLVAAEDEASALDRTYAIGNRQGRDTLRREWSSDIRSVSVGDVIRVVTVERGLLTAGNYAVEPFGFRLLPEMPDAEYGEVALVRLGVARPAGVPA